MSKNYSPTGNIQTSPGDGKYSSEAWSHFGTAASQAFWKQILADQNNFQNFLLNFELFDSHGHVDDSRTQQAVGELCKIAVLVTKADCVATGADFELFDGIVNWTTSLALMKAQAKTYQV